VGDLRDHFAGIALAELLRADPENDQLAIDAYIHADAMMKARGGPVYSGTSVGSLPIRNFEQFLSVRTNNMIRRLQIDTIGELAGYTMADLLSTKYFGATSLGEIEKFLHAFGLRLAGASRE
jgi:DNA-directed RNA polymerase alpha subunit